MTGPVKAAPAFKALAERGEDARELALTEIKALKQDLEQLRRILVAKRPAAAGEDFSLHDVVHGALEIFRAAHVVLENDRLLTDMDGAVSKALAEDFLTAHEARLLKKPAGWHWISPKGEMVFLGEAEEPAKAAQVLKRRLPRKSPAPAEAPDTPEDLTDGG